LRVIVHGLIAQTTSVRDRSTYRSRRPVEYHGRLPALACDRSQRLPDRSIVPKRCGSTC